MNFDLWTLFVEQVFGGFWLAVFGLALIIFLIMAVFGRMSKLTSIYYLLFFMLSMTVGYGYKWMSALIGIALLVFVYLGFKNATGG